jgi:hypothetical protein
MLMNQYFKIYFSAFMTASAYSKVLDLPPRSPVMVYYMLAYEVRDVI